RQVDRLVRTAEAGKVGSNAAKAGVADGWYDLPPQKRPRGLAVQEHDRRPVALVKMGQANPLVASVARPEGKVRQALQHFLRRADGGGHGGERYRRRRQVGSREDGGCSGYGPLAMTRPA